MTLSTDKVVAFVCNANDTTKKNARLFEQHLRLTAEITEKKDRHLPYAELIWNDVHQDNGSMPPSWTPSTTEHRMHDYGGFAPFVLVWKEQVIPLENQIRRVKRAISQKIGGSASLHQGIYKTLRANKDFDEWCKLQQKDDEYGSDNLSYMMRIEAGKL